MFSPPKKRVDRAAAALEHVFVPSQPRETIGDLSKGQQERALPGMVLSISLLLSWWSQSPGPGDQDQGTAFLSSTSKRTPQRGAARPAGSPARGSYCKRGWLVAGGLLLAPPRVCARISKVSAAVSVHYTYNACGNNCSLHHEQGIGKRTHGSMVRSIHHT